MFDCVRRVPVGSQCLAQLLHLPFVTRILSPSKSSQTKISLSYQPVFRVRTPPDDDSEMVSPITLLAPSPLHRLLASLPGHRAQSVSASLSFLLDCSALCGLRAMASTDDDSKMVSSATLLHVTCPLLHLLTPLGEHGVLRQKLWLRNPASSLFFSRSRSRSGVNEAPDDDSEVVSSIPLLRAPHPVHQVFLSLSLSLSVCFHFSADDISE